MITSAIDYANVQLLETEVRKTLVADINGGFRRIVEKFFTLDNFRIEERQAPLLALYQEIQKHFEELRIAIGVYKMHGTNDKVTA